VTHETQWGLNRVPRVTHETRWGLNRLSPKSGEHHPGSDRHQVVSRAMLPRPSSPRPIGLRFFLSFRHGKPRHVASREVLSIRYVGNLSVGRRQEACDDCHGWHRRQLRNSRRAVELLMMRSRVDATVIQRSTRSSSSSRCPGNGTGPRAKRRPRSAIGYYRHPGRHQWRARSALATRRALSSR